VRIRRVSGVPVIAPVEWQKDGVLACQPGGHLHFAVGHREMDQRPRPELEERFALGQPVILVLQHGIGDVLGEVGLQFSGGDRDSGHEEHQIDAVAFEAKRCRHVSVAIPEMRVSRGIAVSPRQ
jgi:hypothetical protein